MISLPPKPERKIKESDILGDCIRSVSRIRGVRVSRNNVGTIQDIRGIPVTFGLGNGSPDIVGIITVGGAESAIARYQRLGPMAFAFGLEVKTEKKYATRDQRAWSAVAGRRGMHVGSVVRSGDEAARRVTDLLEQLELWLDAVSVPHA